MMSTGTSAQERDDKEKTLLFLAISRGHWVVTVSDQLLDFDIQDSAGLVVSQILADDEHICQARIRCESRDCLAEVIKKDTFWTEALHLVMSHTDKITNLPAKFSKKLSGWHIEIDLVPIKTETGPDPTVRVPPMVEKIYRLDTANVENAVPGLLSTSEESAYEICRKILLEEVKVTGAETPLMGLFRMATEVEERTTSTGQRTTPSIQIPVSTGNSSRSFRDRVRDLEKMPSNGDSGELMEEKGGEKKE